jgi:hypothetical protein
VDASPKNLSTRLRCSTSTDLDHLRTPTSIWCGVECDAFICVLKFCELLDDRIIRIVFTISRVALTETLNRAAIAQPEMVYDLPAGMPRLMQAAKGYVATLVAGEVVQENGMVTDARPGKLVRGTEKASA